MYLPIAPVPRISQPFSLLDRVWKNLSECFRQKCVQQTRDCADNAEYERRQRPPEISLRNAFDSVDVNYK